MARQEFSSQVLRPRADRLAEVRELFELRNAQILAIDGIKERARPAIEAARAELIAVEARVLADCAPHVAEIERLDELMKPLQTS